MVSNHFCNYATNDVIFVDIWPYMVDAGGRGASNSSWHIYKGEKGMVKHGISKIYNIVIIYIAKIKVEIALYETALKHTKDGQSKNANDYIASDKVGSH